jgi:hypothetical protein
LEQYKKKAEALVRRDESTCSICNKESINKTARLKHEAIIHKKETQKYKCDECPKSYTSMGTLHYHMRTRHGRGEEVKESCDVCGKQFSSVGAVLTTSLLRKFNVKSVLKQYPHFPTLNVTCANSTVIGIRD